MGLFSSLFSKKGNKTNEIKACVSGTVIPMEQVSDPTFASKLLGDGVAIEPSGEVLCAPADGEITAVMDGSYHACGMKLADGVGVLMHIGIDTVEMEGKGFSCKVKTGDKVKAGEELIRFSKAEIEASGRKATTMLIFTEAEGKNINLISGMEAVAGDTVVAIIE